MAAGAMDATAEVALVAADHLPVAVAAAGADHAIPVADQAQDSPARTAERRADAIAQACQAP